METQSRVKSALKKLWDGTKKTAEDTWKYTALSVAGLGLASGMFAQKADVNVNLLKPNNHPASGIISIFGDTNIIDNTFVSPKNYVLKNITGIDDTLDKDKEIVVAGNPTSTGNTKLIFRNYEQLEGKIRTMDINGRVLATADLSRDQNINFSTMPGTIFVQYLNGTEKETFKVINTSHEFNMEFVQENGMAFTPVKNDPVKSLKSSKGSAADNYTLNYTDPADNVESFNESFTVLPGNTHNINEILLWTMKGFSYSIKNTNKDSKLEVSKSGSLLETKTAPAGVLAKQTITDRFDNEIGVPMEYLLTAPFTDTVKYSMTQFRSEEFVIDTLRKGWFYTTITGNGQNYLIKKAGIIVVPSTPVGTKSLFKSQGDDAAVSIEVSGSGLVDKVVSANLAKGEFTQNITLDAVPPTNYSHDAYINLVSSLAGKTIMDATQIYATFVGTTDTLKLNSVSQAVHFHWDDNTATRQVKFGAKNVAGHNAAEITVVVDDNESAGITFPAKSYSFTHLVHVHNQTAEDVSNVSVAGCDATVVTDATGNASVSRTNLPTDANNVPYANYVTNLTLTGTNIQTLATSITSLVGTNSQTIKNVNQVYSHLLRMIGASSIDGKVIKDATAVYLHKDVNMSSTLTSQEATFTWSDLYKVAAVTLGSSNVPGHQAREVAANVDDNETVTVTFTGLTYSFSQPVLVKDQNNDLVAGANVAGGDAPVVTGADGKATYSKSNLTTDINNLPFANYVTALLLTKTGYDNLNTNLTSIVGTNIEQLLSMVKQSAGVTHDFFVYLKDINGDKVTDLTQRIEWGDGYVQNVTPDADGKIHIQRTETGTPSTKLKVSNTSMKYSDFQVWQDKNKSEADRLRDTAYACVQNFATSNFVEVNLTGIPSELVEYVSKEKVKVPNALIGTYGDSISIYHPVVRDMMGGRNSDRTIKFMSTTSIPVIDVVQFLFNNTTGSPIAQSEIDRAKAELDKVLAIYTLNDGTKLFNFSEYQISSKTDPRWQAIISRGGDNCAYTTFYDGSPYNGVTPIASFNGKPRIKTSNSIYSTAAATGIIFTEIYQQFTNNKDPTEDSSPWVYSNSNVTEFGKTMARILYIINQSTPTK